MIKLVIGSTKISFHSTRQELDHRDVLRAQAATYRELGHEVNYYDERERRFFYIPFDNEEEAVMFKLTHM